MKTDRQRSAGGWVCAQIVIYMMFAATALAGTGPTITTQPQGLFIPAGVPATFSISATGAAPLAYNWQKNGIKLTIKTLL